MYKINVSLYHVKFFFKQSRFCAQLLCLLLIYTEFDGVSLYLNLRIFLRFLTMIYPRMFVGLIAEEAFNVLFNNHYSHIESLHLKKKTI